MSYSAIAYVPTSPIMGHAKFSHSSLVVSWQRIYNSFTVTTAHIKLSFHKQTPLYSFVCPQLSFLFRSNYSSTDCWSEAARMSWNKALVWGLRPDHFYCLTVAGLLIWGALWREDGHVVYNCWWSSPAPSFSGPEFHGTHHNLLSQIRDFPFRRLLRLSGLRWRYSTPPPHGRLYIRVFLSLIVTMCRIVLFSWDIGAVSLFNVFVNTATGHNPSCS
jgi:hypothetical protein